MAAALQIHRRESAQIPWKGYESAAKILKLPEFAGVFRGRELTRKDRRLCSGLLPIDSLIGGGIVRGRISEITGVAGSGKTSLAASFLAVATRHEEVAAWIDAANDFDPESFAAANVDLARVLWVSCDDFGASESIRDCETRQRFLKSAGERELKAAEWLLAAGGLGLVVIDFGGRPRALPQSAALRLARAAERSGTAVIVLAAHRMCGTFAALSVALRRDRACFSRPRADAPVLFDGTVIEAQVARNKLGGSGGTATWKAAIDAAAFVETRRYERTAQQLAGDSAAL